MFPAELRSEREQVLRIIGLVVSSLVWLPLLVGLVLAKWGGLIGVAYILLIAGFVVIASALFMAHLRGNGVRIGPTQLPHLWNKIIAAATRLGLPQPPDAYLIQSGGVLNAFATKILSRKFIVLYSDLVDACEAGDAAGRPSEVDFVIAHEIAHLAAGHLGWMRTYLLPLRFMPLLGPAYSRACEYTCDRAGHAFVGNLELSSRALAILAGGRRAGRMLDLDVFVEQRRESGHFWMAIYELNSTHPFLPKRVAAIREFATPGTHRALGRNVAAYPLAPMFGVMVGGPAAVPMLMVIYIGIVAAIALPAFKKTMRQAEALKAQQQAMLEPGGAAADATPATRTDEPGVVRGELFDWALRLPNARWRMVPSAQARKQNPLTDRWLTRADLDAHLLVIGEHLSGQPMTIDQLAQTVLGNARKSAAKFRIIKQSAVGRGRLFEVRSTVGGMALTQFFGVFIQGDNAYQVYGFAPEASNAKVKDELTGAIASFQAAD